MRNDFIKEGISLASLTTLGVGGRARFYTKVTNKEELSEAVNYACSSKLPFIVLGKGSNVLFLDEQYDGLVIKNDCRGVVIKEDLVEAEGGVGTYELVKKAHQQGLVGLELLANIPGTLGGCIWGNAGGRGFEIGDVVISVEAIKCSHGQLEKRVLTKNDCSFEYRSSLLKKESGWVVIGAKLQLKKGDIDLAKEEIKSDWEWRHEKQPYDKKSAGSIFKNPDPEQGIFAGELIEKAGFKGYQVGGAEISEKHANFIVNNGQATSKDIKVIIDTVKEGVEKKFGVTLEPEIVII
jgi:UDP-N-acetylmuramate dehydrogenase